MGNSLRITLRGGERIFINGAVIKADRKVGLEFLNGATFLLEQHFMMPEDATTPLAQLYFLIQSMLIDPVLAPQISANVSEALAGLQSVKSDTAVLAGLQDAAGFLKQNRPLEALKRIRALLALEAAAAEAGATQKPSACQG